MSDSPDIKNRIYQAYQEHSHGEADWHPSVVGEIRHEIAGGILEVLSGGLSDEDLTGLSELLARLMTAEKRGDANAGKPVFNAD